jgi:hypothetical protein
MRVTARSASCMPSSCATVSGASCKALIKNTLEPESSSIQKQLILDSFNR